ncbi:MAG: nuclear transport factor 2 family protein [Flavobacteriaceae bacterium]|nr:nuclear transport factor 2 family protein [Flavobacteriaceae bacterium]
MKKIFLILLLLPLLISCDANDKKSEQNIALIESYVSAVENMEYDAMASFLADDYLGLGPSIGDSISKDEAIKNWKFNVENLYKKIEYNRSRNMPIIIDSGDNQGQWVSNWAELKITYKDNDIDVTIWANTIYQIDNDKIIKSFTFYNEADVLEQMGYIFINPNDL